MELDLFNRTLPDYDALANDPDNRGCLFCEEIADAWLTIYFEALNYEVHLYELLVSHNTISDCPALVTHVLNYFRRRLSGTQFLFWAAQNVPNSAGAIRLLTHIGQIALFNFAEDGLNRFEGFLKLASRCATVKQKVILEVNSMFLFEAAAIPYFDYFTDAEFLSQDIENVLQTFRQNNFTDLLLFNGELQSKRIGLCQLVMDWIVARFYSKNIVILRSYGEHLHAGYQFQVSDYTFSIINVSSSKSDVLGTLIHEIAHSNFREASFIKRYEDLWEKRGLAPSFQEEVIVKWAEIFLYGKLKIDPNEDLRIQRSAKFISKIISEDGIRSPLKHMLCEEIFDNFVPSLNDGELAPKDFLLVALYTSLKIATQNSADILEMKGESSLWYGPDISYAVGTYFAACEALLTNGLGSVDPYSDRIVLSQLINGKTTQLSHTDFFKFKANLRENR